LKNTKETPQAIWPIAMSLANRDGPRAPTVVLGPLGPKFLPVDKVNATADCLEKQFTPHKLCDENYERQVEVRVQAVLEAAPRKRKAMRLTEINKFLEIEEGLWN
jgi:hypothetical protein